MITTIIAQATQVAETVPAETGEAVETVIDALTAAAAVLPMPWSAIAAGALGLAGTLWAWKRKKKDK